MIAPIPMIDEVRRWQQPAIEEQPGVENELKFGSQILCVMLFKGTVRKKAIFF
jgi:hypothetical protein